MYQSKSDAVCLPWSRCAVTGWLGSYLFSRAKFSPSGFKYHAVGFVSWRCSNQKCGRMSINALMIRSYTTDLSSVSRRVIRPRHTFLPCGQSIIHNSHIMSMNSSVVMTVNPLESILVARHPLSSGWLSRGP